MKNIYHLYDSLDFSASAPTRATVDLDALRANYRLLCSRLSSGTRPIAVVKADAYGHGAPACVEVLATEGCDFFAVSCLAEAREVRKVCARIGHTADVLILGYTDPAHARELADLDIVQALLSPEYAHALAEKAAQCDARIRVHVALDTGMHRIGFATHPESAELQTLDEIAALHRLPSLAVEGMFSHFSTADAPDDPAAVQLAERQALRFARVKDALCARKIPIGFCHLCNSAGALQRADDFYDGVRLGVALYGVDPIGAGDLPLRSVMHLETRIVHLHTLLPGEALGYGGDFTADTPRTVATLPIGYADGLLRATAGASVTLHTKAGDYTVPLIGRICMDQCMLDVTDTDAALEDAVTLFGTDPAQLSALSDHAHTIPYELLTSVSARVPRFYINGAQNQ